MKTNLTVTNQAQNKDHHVDFKYTIFAQDRVILNISEQEAMMFRHIGAVYVNINGILKPVIFTE